MFTRSVALLLAPLLAMPLAAAADPLFTLSPLVNADGSYQQPVALNNAGEVLLMGSGRYAFNDSGAYVTTQGNALVEISGDKVTPLALPDNAAVHAMNNQGQVVGDAPPPGWPYLSPHAFVYSPGDGAATMLGSNYNSSHAVDINSAGHVLGNFDPGCGWTKCAGGRGFLYDGQWHELGTLGGIGTSATAINDNDVAVGFSWGLDNSRHPVMLFADGSIADLSAGMQGVGEGHAWDINSAGTVVGDLSFGDAGLRAFVYRDGQLVDLNTLIDPASGWTLTGAIAINDHDQILAFGTDAHGIGGAVLLSGVPAVPEPSPVAQILCGLMILGAGWRRAARAGGGGTGRRS